MSRPKRHETKAFTVRELVDLVDRGQVALPDFQRPFVWSAGQVAELLDSVGHGWPIGSLLLLEGPQPFGIDAINRGPVPEASRVQYYLLDGQQRVTALYHALKDTSDDVYFLSLDGDDFDDDVAVRSQRRASFERTADPTRIKLADIADPDSERVAELSARDRFHLEQASEALSGLVDANYKIPAIVMAQDIGLEALTRIFETLNRTGERLDAFDLMVAVLRPGNFLLRDRWEEARLDAPILAEFGVDGIEILKLIALEQRESDRMRRDRPSSRRVTGIRQRDVLNVPAEVVVAEWPRAVEAYANALRFMRDVGGVVGGDSVPSWAMNLTAAFCIRRGIERSELEAWYWEAILSQTYAQGANTQVLADVDAMTASNRLFSPIALLGDLRAHIYRALREPARRNRILRLGIRGAWVRGGARDAASGAELESPIAEVSVERALRGDFRPSVDDPLSEVALFNRSSLALRRLDRPSLETQALTKFTPEERLEARTDRLTNLLEGWL